MKIIKKLAKMWQSKEVEETPDRSNLEAYATFKLSKIVKEGASRYWDIEAAAGLKDGEEYSDDELLGKLSALVVLASKVKKAIASKVIPIASTSAVLEEALSQQMTPEQIDKFVAENIGLCIGPDGEPLSPEQAKAKIVPPPGSMLN